MNNKEKFTQVKWEIAEPDLDGGHHVHDIFLIEKQCNRCQGTMLYNDKLGYWECQTCFQLKSLSKEEMYDIKRKKE